MFSAQITVNCEVCNAEGTTTVSLEISPKGNLRVLCASELAPKGMGHCHTDSGHLVFCAGDCAKVIRDRLNDRGDFFYIHIND